MNNEHVCRDGKWKPYSEDQCLVCGNVIERLETSLEDVPGDTLAQKVQRLFHELQTAHNRIAELDVEVPY